MLQCSPRLAISLLEQRRPSLENEETWRVPSRVCEGARACIWKNTWAKALSSKFHCHSSNGSGEVPRSWAISRWLYEGQQHHVLWDSKNKLGHLPIWVGKFAEGQTNSGASHFLQIRNQRGKSCWRKRSLLAGSSEAGVGWESEGKIRERFGPWLQV